MIAWAWEAEDLLLAHWSREPKMVIGQRYNHKPTSVIYLVCDGTNDSDTCRFKCAFDARNRCTGSRQNVLMSEVMAVTFCQNASALPAHHIVQAWTQGSGSAASLLTTLSSNGCCFGVNTLLYWEIEAV